MDTGECVDMIQLILNAEVTVQELCVSIETVFLNKQFNIISKNIFFFPAYHERYMLFLKTTLSVGLNFVLTLLVS
jgi:hypothetical protein